MMKQNILPHDNSKSPQDLYTLQTLPQDMNPENVRPVKPKRSVGKKVRTAAYHLGTGGLAAADAYFATTFYHDKFAKWIREFAPHLGEDVKDVMNNAKSTTGMLAANNIGKDVAAIKNIDFGVEYTVQPEMRNNVQKALRELEQIDADYNSFSHRLGEWSSTLGDITLRAASTIKKYASRAATKTSQIVGLEKQLESVQNVVGTVKDRATLWTAKPSIVKNYGQKTYRDLEEAFDKYGSLETAVKDLQKEVGKAKEANSTDLQNTEGDLIEQYTQYLGKIRETFRLQLDTADLAAKYGKTIRHVLEEYSKSRDPETLDTVRNALTNDGVKQEVDGVIASTNADHEVIQKFKTQVTDLATMLESETVPIERLNKAYVSLQELQHTYRTMATHPLNEHEHVLAELEKTLETTKESTKQEYAAAGKDATFVQVNGVPEQPSAPYEDLANKLADYPTAALTCAIVIGAATIYGCRAYRAAGDTMKRIVTAPLRILAAPFKMLLEKEEVV